MRDALDAVGLRGYPRTSGASGMHILVPVVPGLTFDAVRLFARVVSEGAGARPPGPGDDADQGRRPRPAGVPRRQPERARAEHRLRLLGAPAARAPRWRRRCAGRRCAPGLDPRELHDGRGGPAGRAEGDLAGRPAGPTARTLDDGRRAPRRDAGEGPRRRHRARGRRHGRRRRRVLGRRRAGPVATAAGARARPARATSSAPARTASGASLDMHGHDPVAVAIDGALIGRDGTPGERPGGRDRLGGQRGRRRRRRRRASWRCWPTATARSRSRRPRTCCGPTTAPRPGGPCACWPSCPRGCPRAAAATYYVLLDEVTPAEVGSVRMVVDSGPPITLRARRR